MSEKNYNKLLVLPISLCFFVIALFCFFCIGLSKVDAQSFNENLYWDTPTWIQYYSGEPFASNGASGAGQTVLKACNKVNECIAPDGFPTYALVGYNVPDNSTNSNITAFQQGDKFKFQVQFYWILTTNEFVPTDDLNFKFKITSGSSVYNAFCDVGENSKRVQVNDNPRTYEVTYTCDVFNVDRPIRYFMFQLHTRNNIFSRVGVFENFRVIVSPLGVEDIISNADKNKNEIIDNQDKNTDKQIQENRNLLQQLFDFLIGLFIPDSFDFLTGFLDVLEEKLGFVGSVPIQFFEFLIDLVNVDFETVTSITLPQFDVFGYTFFEEQEIDLTEIMEVFAPYRIYTNIGCVCLCIRYLIKLYETFANGEE